MGNTRHCFQMFPAHSEKDWVPFATDQEQNGTCSMLDTNGHNTSCLLVSFNISPCWQNYTLHYVAF